MITVHRETGLLVPEIAEYHLLNATTAECDWYSGRLSPLSGRQAFLQPTNTPEEFRAAIPGRTMNQTLVGRYSLNDFTFKPLLQVPHITFDSMSMWIDGPRQECTRARCVLHFGFADSATGTSTK